MLLPRLRHIRTSTRLARAFYFTTKLLRELIRDGIRCIWRGGTKISASNTDTGVDEIEITEPTAKCALTAMQAYHSADQRS